MKNVVLGLLVLLFAFSCSEDAENQEDMISTDSGDNDVAVSERILIPDAAFEQALIDLNFDNELDGAVDKSRVDFVTDLIIDNKEISDLTGIAGFDALVNLNVRNNQLTEVDVSDNSNLLFVWAEDNRLESIDVDGLSSLEKLGLDRNVLVQLNVNSNSSLQLLTASDNRINAIDVSNNGALTDFTIENNPLNCILVSQAQLDAIPLDWTKDDNDSYSLDCE